VFTKAWEYLVGKEPKTLYFFHHYEQWNLYLTLSSSGLQSSSVGPPREQVSPPPLAWPVVAVLVFYDPSGSRSPVIFNQLHWPAEEAGVASSARRAGGGCAGLSRSRWSESTSNVQSAPSARRGSRRRLLCSAGRRWLCCCWGQGVRSARLRPRLSPSSPPVHSHKLSAPSRSNFPPAVVLTRVLTLLLGIPAGAVRRLDMDDEWAAHADEIPHLPDLHQPVSACGTLNFSTH
jgi:hypothetical protein